MATILTLAAVSVGAGLVGIAVGYLMYVRGRPDPAAVTRATGPLYRALVNKWYVDELYDRRFVGGARALFGAMWAFDVHVVDGIANGLGRLASLGGSGARRLQTGVVGNYALTIVVGLLVIIVAYGGYASGILTR
jgi:NADH:ubiquinone oxidoreductase subunit 5 (subunit L)/multisubunit Na+/H+ antiporter MnhA subunit